MPMPAVVAASGEPRCDVRAVEHDLAGIGDVEAGQDLHEGGLAGAVLAEQAVQAPAVDVHADAVIGADRPEVLVDVAQLEAHVPPVDETPEKPERGGSAGLPVVGSRDW